MRKRLLPRARSDGHPAADHFVGAGEGGTFADADEEADDPEGGGEGEPGAGAEGGGDGGEGGEQGPPEDGAGKDAAGAEAVAEPAAGGLEEGVAEDEGGQEGADFEIGERVLLLDVLGADVHVEAVDERQGDDHEEEGEQAPADFGGHVRAGWGDGSRG